jgi:hypothetical protein
MLHLRSQREMINAALERRGLGGGSGSSDESTLRV